MDEIIEFPSNGHNSSLGIYGELDASIPESIVQDFEKQLESIATTHEFHTYTGARRAFFYDNREVYQPDAVEDAWKRTLARFRRHLQ